MKQIAYNKSIRNSPIKYIVIHDTGNRGAGANAIAHFNYFNSGNRNSSADFFVDDTQILQVNDYNKYYTWHCGDGNGKFGIINNNSIGIEMCINSDGDWNKAFNNTIKITKQLMKELNIPIERVIRHYDASHKNCPQTFNNGTWNKWLEFKGRLIDMKLESINDIVWELHNRGIITNKELWLKKLEEDIDSYWLAYKTANMTINKE